MPKDIESYRSPKIAVDAIIFIDNKVVLIERKNPPYGWALPGGFVDYGESLEDAVVREVEEEISLKVAILKQQATYSDPKRDPRGHVISTVFVCAPMEKEVSLKAKDDAKNVQLFSLEDLPELAFDHKKVLDAFEPCRALSGGDL